MIFLLQDILQYKYEYFLHQRWDKSHDVEEQEYLVIILLLNVFILTIVFILFSFRKRCPFSMKYSDEQSYYIHKFQDSFLKKALYFSKKKTYCF